MPNDETDFLLDNKTKIAHLWAKDLFDMYRMLVLLTPDILAGGYTTKTYTEDEKPNIFKEKLQ